MPQVNIFRWRPGSGWLVLSGGGSWDSEDVVSIEASMLGHTLSQGPLAYIWAASDADTADRHMDALRELGARTGYLVDILSEPEDVLYDQLNEAGVIIVGDGPRQDELAGALSGPVQRAIEEAYSRGATVYAVGRAAEHFGAYIVENEGVFKGANWLSNALVVPGYTTDQAEWTARVIAQLPGAYGLGLGVGAALAFGPHGEVESWGSRAVTVALDPRYKVASEQAEGS